ncbi:MAG: hypothetical protein RIG82_09180 [Phycisphaeraceae bacterium]
MRITESPIEIPSAALAMLAVQLRGEPESSSSPDLPELESFALHTWRLGRRVDGMADSDRRIKRQLQDSHKRLTDALYGLGLTIDDPTDRAYTDGWLEVDVIAWEEPDGPAPEGIHGPWVKQTIRPIIRRGDGLLCKGEVVVADPDDAGQATK